ncbi:hypothetical protein L211DRAFT_836805 [Terfezia boudieri ATCC MYA-4762]|uniref:Fibronectin type III-like domain-containing protein n=1 Tax=Terfezia boudieri ATCC MYA-4762 TaxID=1051890 RepID=A0A3N4LPW8_9PEZI|nr:hypothetical protein L211DRAFT_836805 [Terfezia boudieri ATCC MYA-4762]
MVESSYGRYILKRNSFLFHVTPVADQTRYSSLSIRSLYCAGSNCVVVLLRRQLKGFKKVEIEAGKTVIVEIPIDVTG